MSTGTASPALLTKELESAMAKLRRGLAYDPGKYRGAPDKRHIPGLEPEEASALLQHIAALEQRVEALRPHAKWLRQAATEIARDGHAGWGNTCSYAADAIEAALPKEPPRE